jgi:hypothetical protein
LVLFVLDSLVLSALRRHRLALFPHPQFSVMLF